MTAVLPTAPKGHRGPLRSGKGRTLGEIGVRKEARHGLLVMRLWCASDDARYARGEFGRRRRGCGAHLQAQLALRAVVAGGPRRVMAMRDERAGGQQKDESGDTAQ